jgi:hypothetical protein
MNLRSSVVWNGLEILGLGLVLGSCHHLEVVSLPMAPGIQVVSVGQDTNA